MKYTVIVGLPHDIAGDQSCMADEVAREHVEALNPAQAYYTAVTNLIQEYEDRDIDEFDAVAVFEGHHLDQLVVDDL